MTLTAPAPRHRADVPPSEQPPETATTPRHRRPGRRLDDQELSTLDAAPQPALGAHGHAWVPILPSPASLYDRLTAWVAGPTNGIYFRTSTPREA